MKKSFLIIIALLAFIGISNAQKVEVLYFKANLACCHARACSNIENQVKQVVEEHYKDNQVVFKAIRIADETNSELVSKYNAQSQTVVVVSNNKKKGNFVNVSDLVKNYSRTSDKAAFEKEFLATINKML